jgi:hypothetical protein
MLVSRIGTSIGKAAVVRILRVRVHQFFFETGFRRKTVTA